MRWRKKSVKKKQTKNTAELIAWEVYRLTSTPAKFLGLVHALDETSAHEEAVNQFGFQPGEAKSIIVRRH
jgi:hypothetical protein